MPEQVGTIRIVDVHHHVGVLSLSEVRGTKVEPFADLSSRLALMDEHGIAQACLFPANSYPQAQGILDTQRQNDYIAEYRARRPDRFPAACAVVEPLHGEAAVREVRRVFEELGVNGLVFHHRFQGGPINAANMYPILDAARGYHRPIFVHVIAESQLESPWRLEELADAYPDVTFVALDAFSSPSQSQWMSYIATKHANIYFETGAMTSVGNRLAMFLARHGSDRLIYGSDCYMTPRGYAVPHPKNELLALGLARDDLERIFWRNAYRVLGLDTGGNER
ncbi:MAG: amidohydrolase family protein [Actinomycetia bacterium]|nr:amidohydrolase family protein [Actinomycetes bacterium]